MNAVKKHNLYQAVGLVSCMAVKMARFPHSRPCFKRWAILGPTPSTLRNWSRLAPRTPSTLPKARSRRFFRDGPPPPGAKGRQGGFFRGGPPPRHIVQGAVGEGLAAELAVEGDGEAVGLVAQALDQEAARGTPVQPDAFEPARDEDLLETLGQADHRQPLQAERAQGLQGGAQLALASVDHHQIGPGPSLVLDAAVVAGDDLLHAGEIVDPGHGLDLEFPVFAPGRQAPLYDDHGGHGL